MSRMNGPVGLAPEPLPCPGRNGRVYCTCFLRPHRGSQHIVRRDCYYEHFTRCRIENVPFTAAETFEWEQELDTAGWASPVLSIAETEYETELGLELEMHEDEYWPVTEGPLVFRPIHIDFQVAGRLKALRDDPITEEYVYEHRLKIDLYKSFFGTTREQRSNIRNMLSEHYEVQIGEPVLDGQNYLDSMFTGLLEPQWLNCCPDGHMAFTGNYVNAPSCLHCNAKQYLDSGKPASQWQYIPLIPRLAIQYQSDTRSRQLTAYRLERGRNRMEGAYRNDVLDGDWWWECHAHGYFQDVRDLALRITLDGIGLVQNPRPDQSITPVVIYILNLHPATRDKQENALTSFIIPGGFKEEYIDTWLHPLMAEFRHLHEGVENVWDGDSGQTFVLRAHPILVTGDGQAIAEVMGTKHPGGAKKGCRMCPLVGTQDQKRKYYYPHNGNLHHPQYPDLRENIIRISRQLERQNIPMNRQAELRRESGINRASVLLGIPTLHFPRSFPVDTMHCMNQNIPKHFMKLWKGLTFAPLAKPWQLAPKQWESIDRGLKDTLEHVPTCIGTAPRSTSSCFSWTASEYRAFFCTYGAPAMVANLPNDYATVFLQYRDLMQRTSQPQFTRDDISSLESSCQTFVHNFEQCYYQGNQHQLKVCTIQIHYLLHLADNIRDFGSPIYYAQWSLERLLRLLKGLARSNSKKYKSLASNLITLERIQHANWARMVPTQEAPLADNMDEASLILPTNLSLDGTWQRRLDRADVRMWDDERDFTLAANLEVYLGYNVPSKGLTVRACSNPRSNHGNNPRCRSYVAYWDRERGREAFGMVVHFLRDPVTEDEWATVIRWQDTDNHSPELPRPRRCRGVRTVVKERHERDFVCIRPRDIRYLIGITFVYKILANGQRSPPEHYVIDKDGASERVHPVEEEALL